MLHGWDNFFITGSTAGATLIGLLFVAITLGTGLSTARGLISTQAFVTPTLVRFGGVLFLCLAVLVPWTSAWPIGIILGLIGLTGFVYQIYVIFMQRKVDFLLRDWIDRAFFSAAPVLANVSLMGGAAGLIAGKAFAPYAVAGAVTLLLLAGIYGAWSITLWIARDRDKT